MGFMGNEVDSEAQLRAAQNRKYSSSAEADARRLGFNNANEMMTFLEQRQMKRPSSTTSSKQPNMQDAMAWHPAVIFDKISQIFKDNR